MEITNMEQCTGCLVCMNICKKKAISVGYDETGRTIPIIDMTNCVECGLCQKYCPNNSDNKVRKPKIVYAAESRNFEDLQKSTSGGIAFILENYIMNCGGSVYGPVFENGQYVYQKVHNPNILRGSKYVETCMGNCYVEILKELESCDVLFIGLPCQVAGIKSFFSRYKMNHTLYTVDLICHGVPPMKYLKEHMKHKGIEFDRVSKIVFRDGRDYPKIYLKIYDHDENLLYSSSMEKDEYYCAFFHSATYRKNCYLCKYARPERVSDITIGDFWGLEKNEFFNGYSFSKPSVVLVNTLNGEQLISKVCNQLYLCERTYEEALRGNKQLNYPALSCVDREVFIRNYLEKGFDAAVWSSDLRYIMLKQYLRESKLFLFLKKKLKRCVGSIKNYANLKEKK